MKILFTGASSFTGMWFVQELAAGGHHVTATFQKERREYTGLRGDRVQELMRCAEAKFGCSFGSKRFFDVIEREKRWDLFCHHAADVTDYKSPGFDYVRALANNTNQAERVLQRLRALGCDKLLLTGSVFEADEGKGTAPLRAFSPYGLSKGLSFEVFRYFCQILGVKLGKFVIPNPFGPYEEPRFTAYLLKNWLEGKTPSVRTPEYVRDNVPVSLLAKVYRDFAEKLSDAPGLVKSCPSYYAAKQGAFSLRLAQEMEKRLAMPCPVQLEEQLDFSEPKERVNTDPVDPQALGWSEEKAWDALAAYYRTRQASLTRV